jgi:hypothetical protein
MQDIPVWSEDAGRGGGEVRDAPERVRLAGAPSPTAHRSWQRGNHDLRDQVSLIKI